MTATASMDFSFSANFKGIDWLRVWKKRESEVKNAKNFNESFSQVILEEERF